MELLFDIQNQAIELLNIALAFAEPHLLEIIMFLIFSTFAFGFISGYK